MTESHDSAELMYVKCAYCGKWLDVKPGKMNRISHTICPDCFEKEMGQHQTRHPAHPKRNTDA